MKIKNITLTPLFLPFKETYHWAGRIDYGAVIILVKVETESGIIGYGESTSSFPAEGTLNLLSSVVPLFIGESAFNVTRLVHRARYLGLINDTIRMPNLLLAGVEMALWDAIGKSVKLPLYKLWGGLERDYVDYFAFLQGDTAEELVASAQEFKKDNYNVYYMKIGRGEKSDINNVRAVRQAIGYEVKLRVDANEAWDIFTAKNMINKLKEFEIDFLEQPTDCRAISALKQIKDYSPIPIAIDQGAYNVEEVFEVAKREVADVIVLSPHETGGAMGFKKAAAISEAARIPICLHGLFTSGITDLFHHQLALTLPNLTDGNQIMHQLIKEDIILGVDLTPKNGRLGVFEGVGIGFQLNEDAVFRAKEEYSKWLKKWQGQESLGVEFVYDYV